MCRSPESQAVKITKIESPRVKSDSNAKMLENERTSNFILPDSKKYTNQLIFQNEGQFLPRTLNANNIENTIIINPDGSQEVVSNDPLLSIKNSCENSPLYLKVDKREGDENVLPRFALDTFQNYHNLTKTQVESLLMFLGPLYTNPGRRAPLKDFVLASLILLTSKESYREMSQRSVFKSRGWMNKSIHLFCELIVKHLGCLIEWPSGAQARNIISRLVYCC